MSLFKLFTCFVILGYSFVAQAQSKPVDLKTMAVSYVSWTEFMTLDNGTITADAFANFYGTAISYETESYLNRTGFIATVSAAFGQANGGGTQTGITYQKSYQKWFAGMAEYKYAYRISAQTTIAIGPVGIFRDVKWDLQPGVTEAKSGAQVNLGALLDFRVRFTPAWELRQTFGTMAFKASTLWSVGLGYKF